MGRTHKAFETFESSRPGRGLRTTSPAGSAGAAGAAEASSEPPEDASGTEIGHRDRKAAAHRRRRRTLLITAVFVLAVAGLSIAEPFTGPYAATASTIRVPM
jgi:hypothetical protein